MKVSDIAEAFDGSKVVKDKLTLCNQAEEATTLQNYYDLWRDCIAYRFNQQVPKLGEKGRGQITNMNKALPTGVTGPFIYLVLIEWESAADFLKQEDTWKKLPEHPNPGLVLSAIIPLTKWATTMSASPVEDKDETEEKWGI